MIGTQGQVRGTNRNHLPVSDTSDGWWLGVSDDAIGTTRPTLTVLGLPAGHSHDQHTGH